MREKEIEERFCREARTKGLWPLKFTSPGHAGMPDRIVLKPQGRVVFAEIKLPKKKPRPLQITRMEQLKRLGFDTYVIDSKKAIEEFLANEC